MTRFANRINEIKRAAATALLSAGVAAAFFAVMSGETEPAGPRIALEQQALRLGIPDRPAGGRRWRSSNAEQSLPTLIYFGEDDHWTRQRVELERSIALFQVGDTFPTKEIAAGTLRVSLSTDYLSAYLATPYLGGTEPITLALDDASDRPLTVGPVLAGAFATELLGRK